MTAASPRLLLVNYEYPPLGGGAANATDGMARALARRGVAVEVLTSAFAGLPAVEVTADGVTIRRIPTLRRRRDRSSIPEMLAFLASSLVAVPLAARRFRPDAVVAYFGIPCGPAAWLARLLTGVPYVVSLRGGDVPGFQYDGIGLYHRLAGPVIRRVWRGAAAVVANSEGLADLARRFAPEVAVAVVPNGVDTAIFAPGPECGSPTADAPLRLLVVGRLVRQKGIDVVLEAMARLPDPAAVRLSVVGDGPARGDLEVQAQRLGLGRCVAFTGWADRAALPGFYRDADVFLLPSRDEGMPNVVLEAMASGLPVLATDIPGSRDLVVDGETGLLIGVDDTDALVAALGRLAGDAQSRWAMGAAGRRRVAEMFSWEAVADAYLALAAGASRQPADGREWA
jgi:glycogen(starch) synthase